MSLHQKLFIVMGVTACGKSTIGIKVAESLSIEYFDGDDFHPESNIRKMSSGIPLNDEDRLPWLNEINRYFREEAKLPAVLACSALKKSYREILENDIDCTWIYLKAEKELILKRIIARKGHFMPSSLVDSQFEVLEEPDGAIVVNASDSPQKIILKILSEMSTEKNEFGVIGLGVMGESLARNFGRNGIALSIYNREVEGAEEGIALKAVEKFEELKNADPYNELRSFVKSLKRPRKVLVMVHANAVDMVIQDLSQILDQGDIVIDAGNSHYNQTSERGHFLDSKGIHFIGTGVSGGQMGALNGPSIMPGGNFDSYQLVRPFLEMIAAKDKTGMPCCNYIGRGGSGHFVKMVHNGIEYGEMQLIAEAYGLLKHVSNLPNEQIALVFESWQNSKLHSYLLGISAQILKTKNESGYLIDQILDKAGNKGTGNWTTVAASQLGVPIPTIAEALFARYLSSFKSVREFASNLYSNDQAQTSLDVESLKMAYATARIINHHQGFHLIKMALDEFQWDIDLNELARIWTNGCIIRSNLMEELANLQFDPDLGILLHPKISKRIQKGIDPYKKTLIAAIETGAAIPCLSGSFQYFTQLKQAEGTTNLIQAQRDYFGAHQFQLKEDPSGLKFHYQWE